MVIVVPGHSKGSGEWNPPLSLGILVVWLVETIAAIVAPSATKAKQTRRR